MEAKMTENNVLIVSEGNRKAVISSDVHNALCSYQEEGGLTLNRNISFLNECISKFVEFGHDGIIDKEEALNMAYLLVDVRYWLELMKGKG